PSIDCGIVVHRKLKEGENSRPKPVRTRQFIRIQMVSRLAAQLPASRLARRRADHPRSHEISRTAAGGPAYKRI
ncbi:MAG: hypothetical protein E6699_39170, partial [Bradyrhizobium sp.]|uniref:hypothetical protein n=1 Tax=Bradyrhizobium sp. TaxID=376 RepID=UPI0029054634